MCGSNVRGSHVAHTKRQVRYSLAQLRTGTWSVLPLLATRQQAIPDPAQPDSATLTTHASQLHALCRWLFSPLVAVTHDSNSCLAPRLVKSHLRAYFPYRPVGFMLIPDRLVSTHSACLTHANTLTPPHSARRISKATRTKRPLEHIPTFMIRKATNRREKKEYQIVNPDSRCRIVDQAEPGRRMASFVIVGATHQP